MRSPWCCIEPRTGIKVSALAQIIGSLILVGGAILSFGQLDDYTLDEVKSGTIGIGVTWIIYSLFHIGLALILWKSSQESCVKKSRLWLISTSILFVVHLLLLLIALFCFHTTVTIYHQLLIHIPFMSLVAFIIWTVGVFIHDMRGREEICGDNHEEHLPPPAALQLEK